MFNRTKSKSRFCGFRLTEEEHDRLAKVAHLERRKMADLVHLIVVEALDQYTRRLAEEESHNTKDRNQE